MRFLGIDIGYDRCGVCVIEYDSKRNDSNIIFAGSILTNKKLSISERLKILHEDLVYIKKKYQPECMSIEKLFFNRKNMTFEKICMSKGVAMMLFSDIEILEVEPKRVKKCVVGDGNATKPEIRMVVEKVIGMELQSVLDDTIDALCLALYHCQEKRNEILISQSQTNAFMLQI